MSSRARKPVAKSANGASAGTPPEAFEGDARDQGFRIGFLVHDVSRMRKVLFDQEVRSLGITRSQWWVLAQLSRQGPQGMAQTELANALDIGKATVGGLLHRLEAAGFVVRRPDGADRRARRVSITEGGRALLRDMVRISRRLDGLIFAGMSRDEILSAEHFLARMKENIRCGLEGKSRKPGSGTEGSQEWLNET